MQVREPKPGEIIGQNYIIQHELGRGGFGVVFKARHTDIERVVALKVLLATYAAKDPTAVQRFRREATIAASLNYPNTVRVFDYGETDEGVFYLIMEFVQGKDLADIIARKGSVARDRALHITRQILYALMEAHAHGIVHRDIKPENVMIVPLAYDRDHVKVMDFGIAKMVDADESITRVGLTLGTPRYMPVEQLKGKELSAATDLYAVGLCLYEMLLGKPAIIAETAVDAALQVMEGDSIQVPPDSGVTPQLAAIIEKACAKEPEDRYQTCRQLLEDLELYDGGDLAHLPTARAAVAKESGKTMVMQELDADPDSMVEDVDSAAKTQAIASERPPAFRVADTQSMVVGDKHAETVAVEAHASAEAIAGPGQRVAKKASVKTTVVPDGNRLSLVLHGIALLLLLVILIKLFAG